MHAGQMDCPRASGLETAAPIVTRISLGLAVTSVVTATALAALLELRELGQQVLVKAHIVGLG